MFWAFGAVGLAAVAGLWLHARLYAGEDGRIAA